jgi:hypothetical protein
MKCRHSPLPVPGEELLAHYETEHPPGCVRAYAYYSAEYDDVLVTVDWLSSDDTIVLTKGWWRSEGLLEKRWGGDRGLAVRELTHKVLTKVGEVFEEAA